MEIDDVMRKLIRNKALLWIIAAIMFIAAISSIFVFRKKPIEKVYVAGEISLEDSDEKADVKDGYAYETSYSGLNYVSVSLFEKPFKKTDAYVMNKDYINIIGPEEAGVLSERTGKGLEEIYTINYETLDPDTYKSIIEGYADPGICYINRSTDEAYEGAEEVSAMITTFAKDAELIMEVKAYSDRSLVYYDEQSDIVRTKVIGVVYSCKDVDKLKNLLGIDSIEIGEPFSVIYDVYTGADIVINEHSSYVIRKINSI